jgi:hypothetical protein
MQFLVLPLWFRFVDEQQAKPGATQFNKRFGPGYQTSPSMSEKNEPQNDDGVDVENYVGNG